MPEIIAQAFIYLLAVYGFMSLIISIINSIQWKQGLKNSTYKLVLLVKNQEETIEGVIRNIYMENILSPLIHNGKLVVLDMGSKDKTVYILNKLEEEYSDIEVLDWNSRNKIFTGFDENDN